LNRGREGRRVAKKSTKFSPKVSEVAEDIVERLAPLGPVSWKKMFGGAGIFLDGKMFALVNHDGYAHLKVNDSNRDRYESAGSAKFANMPYYSIPSEVLADDALLQEWAAASIRLVKTR